MKLFFLILLVLNLSACSGENIFRPFSDENTDKALLKDAERALNKKNWSLAISKIQSMSVARQSEEDVLFLLASAYSGQCRMEFLPFASAFGGLSGTLFSFLLTYFVDSDATTSAACASGEDTYDSITSNLGISDYINKVFLSMGKTGNILNHLGATAANALDPAFDPCADIPDAEASHLFTALSRIIVNLANSGLSTGGGLGDVSALCTTAGLDCDKTNIADVTANERAFVKSLVNTSDVGLSVCTNGDGSMAEPTCLCAP